MLMRYLGDGGNAPRVSAQQDLRITSPDPRIIRIRYSYGLTHVYRKIVAADGSLLASDSFRRGAGDPAPGTLRVVELVERAAQFAI